MKVKSYLPKEGEVQAMVFTNAPGDTADLIDWLHINDIRSYRFGSSFGGTVTLVFTDRDGREHEAEQDMVVVRHEDGRRWSTMRADPFFDRYDEVTP